MLISLSVLQNLAAVALHSSLNNSSGQAEEIQTRDQITLNTNLYITFLES